MEFKRISAGLVRCIVEQEDLEEYDIKVEDFLKNSENMHEFLQMIVERAREEVGYTPKDMGSMAVQIMPLSRNRLAITLIEGNVGDVVEAVKENIGDLDGAFSDRIKRMVKELSDSRSEEDNKETKAGDVCVAVFENFNMLAQYVNNVSDVTGIASALYYDIASAEYILVLKCGKAPKERFEAATDMVAEYGIMISDEEITIDSVKEHNKCIISKDAIAITKNMI